MCAFNMPIFTNRDAKMTSKQMYLVTEKINLWYTVTVLVRQNVFFFLFSMLKQLSKKHVQRPQLEEPITWEGLTIKFNIIIRFINFPQTSNTPQKLCTPCETVYALCKLNYTIISLEERFSIFQTRNGHCSMWHITSSWYRFLGTQASPNL